MPVLNLESTRRMGMKTFFVIGVLWIGALPSLGPRAFSTSAQVGGGPDETGTFTAQATSPEGLPAWLSKGVENSLELRQAETGIVIAGATDASAHYQLISSPVALGPGVFAVRPVLEGSVKSGGLYVGLLDDSGGFLASPLAFGEGPIETETTFLTYGNKNLRIVLGNAAPGKKSEWEISRLGLQRFESEPSSRFESEFRNGRPGYLPQGMVQLATNSARISATSEGTVLSVRTDRGGGPQLGLKPVQFPDGAADLWFRLEGEVLEGGIYCQLLDEHGKKAVPTMFLSLGLIPPGAGLIPVGRRRSISLVIGNAQAGQSSRVEISRLELSAVTPEQRSSFVRKLAVERRFQGSAWLWALRVLSGQPGFGSP